MGAMPDREQDDEAQGGVGLRERDEQRVRRPRMYRVLLHNDDYTPIQFVVELLVSLFRKSTEDASAVALQVHEEGVGVAGVYTREIAETKAAQVRMLAMKNDHPLMSSSEPAD